ncbi:unnamed protein product [Spirodela intermedia]|uniref:Uncharacterized protein n=2 Tax=Spirodela intermedia TaxID=51605 RepID=A0A7I8K407_SPIIN|nr:unnamed protein product [Spirodela intermedia]CAA6655583.1 unnamed protein product [Spirodela intermedia]CAA7390886.1 unnamed protein product [Spirodela intermedia]
MAEGLVAEEGGGWTEQGDEEREIRDLEAEVNEMAERIQRSRRTVPGRLAEALSAQLAAQRPRIPSEGAVGLQDNSSQNETSGEAESDTGASSFPESDQEMQERLQTLRSKLRSNIDATPEILKRIKGCMERLNRIDQSSGAINPVFQKRRKNWPSI